MADIRFLPNSSHTTSLLLNRHRQIQNHHRLSLNRHRRLNFSSVHFSPSVYLFRSQIRDSNAEPYNSQKFNFNNNNNNNDGEAESEIGDDDNDEIMELIGDYIDSIWIFKVFGSYGWMLPPILISLLLSNGLKAFLITLALPLSQSTFTFVLEKIQNKGKNKPKPNTNKANKKRRSRPYSSKRNVKFDEEEEEEEWYTIIGARKEKKGYQSWASKNDFSVSGGERNAKDYGGWDEFEAGMESDLGPPRTRKSSGTKGKDTKKIKLSSRWSEKDTPLLLRLMISIFPFLSSWNKLL